MLTTKEIQEYQRQAMTTCTPECFSNDYLHYGLIAEIGELAGKVAKKIRGDKITDDEIKGEIGDIAWFIVVQSRYDGHRISSANECSAFPFDPDVIDRLLMLAAGYAPGSRMWVLFEALCFGYRFDAKEVLRFNIEKLASRQKRGKIRGNGDFR